MLRTIKYHPFEICWQRQEHGPINEHRNTCGGRTSAVWRDALGTTDGLVTLLLEAGFQQMSQVGKEGSLAKMLKTFFRGFSWKQPIECVCLMISADVRRVQQTHCQGCLLLHFWDFLDLGIPLIQQQVHHGTGNPTICGSKLCQRTSVWSEVLNGVCLASILSQVLCANYFHLKARNAQMQEINSGRPAPIRFALYSMFRSLEKNRQLIATEIATQTNRVFFFASRSPVSRCKFVDIGLWWSKDFTWGALPRLHWCLHPADCCAACYLSWFVFFFIFLVLPLISRIHLS